MLQQLIETRSTAALDSDGTRLLLRTDVTGVDQLAEWRDGAVHLLTDDENRVAAARYRPGHRQAIVEGDVGGNERGRLWLMDLDVPVVRDLEQLRPLTTDPTAVHHLAGVSPDGRMAAVLSDRRNRVDFDVWLWDLDTGQERLLYDGGGYCSPASGFSPDGRWLTVLRPGSRAMDTDLLLIDVATGEHRVLLPHPDEGAMVGAPAWIGPTTALISSNVGRDRCALVRLDVLTGEAQTVVEHEWDVDAWASPDGGTALVVANVDGSSSAELLDTATLAFRGPVALPDDDAVIAWSYHTPAPLVLDDGRAVVTSSSPVVALDVWRIGAGQPAERLTTGTGAVDPAALFRPERHRATSFDGLEVPLFLFRPDSSDAAAPVVVYIHGGPESQSQTSFDPVVQALVASGYAVVVPNVRGSTGYGKHYYGLDDSRRRLDSVRDLAAVHDWLSGAGLDPARAVLWGGSYGGYMVLAGVAFQPELWSAGVDIVGMSDLVSFLENTSDYRRAAREREYGSLATDREFLATASPLRSVEAIRAPLFVVHGRNDPRVPVTEAEQLVAALRQRDVPVDMVIYEDEGHGLSRLANELDAYPRAIAFLDRVLRSAESARPGR